MDDEERIEASGAELPGKEVRPRTFPDGMQIGLHLTIERLLSMGPGRTWYLAHNRNPRWYTHICWNCGNKHNPLTAQACVYCQHVLRERHFLLSCRWAAHQVGPFHRFAAARLRHFAINAPIVLYQYREQLLAFHEIGDEALLIDEPGPLRPRTLLSGAWTLAAGLSFLLERGFELERLGPEHVLIGKEGARLWDLDVLRTHTRSIGRGDAHGVEAARRLGAMLLPYTPPDQGAIVDFFRQAAAGRFEDVVHFQHELQRFARDLHPEPSPHRCAALSSVGRKRPNNEDAWAWRKVGDTEIYIVADGMGGYAAGDVASLAAVETAMRWLTEKLPRAERTREAWEEVVRQALESANREVRELGRDAGRPVGTTAVVLVLRPDRTGVLGHVGDSRAYRWRAGALEPLTEDHSMVAAMVDAGKIDREAARVHPRANVLLRYLGSAAEADADVTSVTFAAGDRILLCTDGLWGELPESVLAARIDPTSNPRRVLRTLVGAANDAGGKDNVTGLVISV